MTGPPDFPSACIFYIAFSASFTAWDPLYSATNINSTLSHCFFGGSSELATDFNIPVVGPPPPNFDYSSTIVINVKILRSSDVLFSFVCFFVYYYIASCLCLSYARFYSHFRALTKRSRLSLIRHQKISALHFRSFWYFSNQMEFILLSKSECELEKSALLTIQNSSIGHRFMIFETTGIKYHQVKCAVFLVYRKIYITKELGTWNVLHQNLLLVLTIAWLCCSFFNPHFFIWYYSYLFSFFLQPQSKNKKKIGDFTILLASCEYLCKTGRGFVYSNSAPRTASFMYFHEFYNKDYLLIMF